MMPPRAARIVAHAAALLLGGQALASPLATTAPLSAEPRNPDVDGQIISSNASLHRPPLPNAPVPAANPLWAIPLTRLLETRERPLFSPSRRPPPPAVARAPYTPPVRPPHKQPPPERPQLALVGTIVGNGQGFGLFLEPSTKAVIRLKTGGAYHGWTLRTVGEREAVLEKDHLDVTLAMPVHGQPRPHLLRRNVGRRHGETDGAAADN